MQTHQLELTLWDDLERASATPEAADIAHLWAELEQFITGLPSEQQLHTAGKAIAQLAEVFASRSELILSAWEEAHSDEGPAVDEDAIAGFVRQTMTLDLSELMEELAPARRQPRSPSVASVAGPVDKAALLEAFDSEIEAVEAEAQQASGALSVAHEEDVAGWGAAIAQWLDLRRSSELVSLTELQQGLKLPLVQVWLGLLLSQRQPYQLEQQGEFYDAGGIRLRINALESRHSI